MNKSTLKKINGNVYLLYTLLFFLIGGVAYFWVFASGKSMLKNVDAFYQWYPFIVYLRRSVKELFLHGNFNFWAWDIGVGNDTIVNMGNVFFDPFNYVAAAFPINRIDLGYTVAEFLRLYVAGLLMLRFLRYRGSSRALSLIGAVSYVFCSWGLRATAQASFLTQMVIFPLIILGIEKFEKEKKSLLFTLSIAFSLITSLYFSYMNCILVVIYLIVRYRVNSGFAKDKWKDFLSYVGKYALRVLISVLIAGAALMPSLLGLMQASKGEKPEYLILPELKTALSYLPGYISNYEIFGNYSAVSLGAFFFAMIPAMFICIRNKKCSLPIIMFFICAVFLFFPIFNNIFNGFNYAVARWCYGMMFFYTWAGISSYENIDKKDPKAIRKYITGALILYGIVLVNMIFTGVIATIMQRGAFYVAMINLVFAVIFGILLFLPSDVYKRRTGKAVALALVAADLALCTFVYYAPNITSQLTFHHDNDVAFAQYQKSLMCDFDPAIDNDFYRVDYKEGVSGNPDLEHAEVFTTFSNESMYTGIPSVFSYSSMMDPLIFDFDEALGVNNIYRTMNNRNDGRSRLNLLFGTQFFVAGEQRYIDNAAYGFTTVAVNDDTTVMQNIYDVGLGYVYPDVITESEVSEFTSLELEQTMMQAAIVPDCYDGNANKVTADDIVIDTTDVPFEIAEMNGLELNGNTLTVNEKNASIVLSIDPVSDSELYIAFTDVCRNARTLSEIKAESLPEDASSYDRMMFDLKNIGYEDDNSFRIDVRSGGTHVAFVNKTGASSQAIYADEYLGHLGYYEEGPAKITINFDKIGTYDLGAINVYAVSQENFDSQASALVADRFVTESLSDDKVKGYVDSEGGLLYLSIINNGGWTAYVDGKKVDIIDNVNIAFIGIEVESGFHTIELRYECPGFKLGVVMTAVGIIAFAELAVYEYKKRSASKAK